MDPRTLQPSDLNFDLTVRHFSPAWFAAVMGTGVVPLALSFTGADWTPGAARIFVPLAALMLVLALVPWLIKHLVHRLDSDKDFDHPVAANFLPTLPIALVVLALDLLKFGELFLPAAAAQRLAWWLWVVGSAGIYVLGFAVLLRIYRHEGIQVGHANFGWFIPPVSKLIIPVAGFELAGIFPAWQDGIFAFSAASLGVGFFLYLFVGAAVYHRYVYAGLPAEKFAATYFIGVAPTAIIAVALFKLVHLVEHHPLLGLGPSFAPLAKLLILVCWGLAAWWFLMALLVVGYTRIRRGLPFALSWWAFTFPSGALAIASGIAAKVSGVAAIRIFYNGVMVFLLVIWLVVFVLTVRGLVSRKLLLPAH
ncbi:MAG: hypothetical protein KDA21_04685 [Phycisphaerales bacterium]|nr:hypothetical protein [Phycisphaerales bacterium]